jgi:aspartyl-tRNA(Asn)/glutamyl-tRNA(Gln) amidotransferase subunit B
MNFQTFEPVIGLEIHAQLLTKTKLFCGCSTRYGSPPNSLTCPVCFGLPGALPVFNREAMLMAVKLGLALKAKIHRCSVFSRKNYFYPDLPKGYQITQYHSPFATEGCLEIDCNRASKTIGIARVNIEEDAGKSIHDGMDDSSQKTHLDFNRSGIPLLEIVSKPEISSPQEAVEFLQLLKTVLRYLEICDGNMEEGNLRCDANLSVRKKGADELGVKVEVKNLNSFRFLHKALEYEFKRHVELITSGQPVLHQTRLWDSQQEKTVLMRTKEEADDYRYFPEPDLPPLLVPEELVKKVRAVLPELPREKIERFTKEYKTTRYEAKILTSTRKMADYFEETAKASQNPEQSSRWILREVLQHLKEAEIEISEFPVSSRRLAELIRLVEKKEITLRTAKEKVFPEMLRSRKKAADIVREKKLNQISDAGKIRGIILQIVAVNPKPLRQYLEGKTQVLGFFFGQVMKETKGSANPELVDKLLRDILNSQKNKLI